MAPIKLHPGSPEQIDTLATCFVVAVDLGFSRTSRSCGVAWRDADGVPRSEAFRFGECIEEVARLLKGHPRVVLIIEAPLSGLFTSTGNPVGRGDFERRGLNFSSSATRYWYTGAGAATCLAAVFFLRKLLAEMERLTYEARPVEAFLYEGFITFKPEPTEHVSDAEILLDCFLGARKRLTIQIEAATGQSLIAVTDVVAGFDSGSGAPTIIAPRNTNA